MASPATRRRSRSLVESEHEADMTRFARNVSPTTSDGSKRMRLRGGRGDHSHLEMEDRDGEEAANDDDDFRGTHGFTLRTNGRSASNGTSATEFSPGSIVRVLLENFVTYERAEFFPGPNLNMVIGPNGTGKSSLVCAICLGLGYPASVLGRATSFGEFVKHGKENAIVEIELQKRPQDRLNYVVKLKINREENTRQFWFNGDSITHKKIQVLINKLRIQIDNLCQFLPQEKVAEFAGLNPVELLGKTLQAAASREMITQQAQLKEMFDIQKRMQRDFQTDAEKLRSWQTRQQGLQADVERLRERDQIKNTVAELKEVRLIVDYTQKKEVYLQVKDQKKRAQRHQRQLEERYQPSLEDVNKKEACKAQIESVLRARIQHSKDLGRSTDEALEAVENAMTDIQNKENERSAAESSFCNKKKDLGALRSEIARLEAQTKTNPCPDFSAAEYNHKIREQDRLQREIGERLQEITAERERAVEEARPKADELKRIKGELANLDSQEGQKLHQLAGISPDAREAYNWLQEHQNDFEKDVFGPPILTCSVKDKRFADQVQSVLQRDDFLCFTAQNKNDYQKLTDQFYKKMGLAVSVRTITSDLSSFRPPIPREGLGQFSLDGYALDYVDGPRPVLAMLCSERKIHLTGVSLHDINDQQYQKLIDGQAISSFIMGKTYYRIVRRKEYGPGATSTTTRTIQPGSFWTDEPVDGSVKAELQEQLRKCQVAAREFRSHVDELKTKRDNLNEQVLGVKEEKKRLEAEKRAIQTEFNKWKAIPIKIDLNKDKASALEEAMRKEKERASSFADERNELVLKKAELVIRHQESLQALRDANDGVIEARVRLIETISDLVALKERNADIVQKLAEEKRQVEELARRLDDVKDEARSASKKAEEVLGKYQDQQRLIDAAAGKTVEDINEDIETEMAKLEVIQDADPGVLRDFEKRARDIEKLQGENATRQADMEQLNEQIRDLREKWEPGLDELIRRINDAFSYNFEQISCAGEVGVHKDEDFDKWAVEIKVKFRENETLQKLDQHRQSGGERAVSTIFYLMSLQSMAQSPFRVVDEINQGMDPRNERMVHERMVEIACREHTSQYFLITPKLLSGLRYDERMKVLCIASGEHMPKDGSQLDFSKCVKIKRQLLAAASA